MREVKNITWGFALLLLGLAVYFDLRYMRIPNAVILSGILGAIFLWIQRSDTGGVIEFLIYLMIPVIILYPVYLLGGLGAGDVKLFSALSVIVGWRFCLSIMIYSFIFGASIGILRWIRNGDFLCRMRDFRLDLQNILVYKQNSACFIGKKEKLHFTVPIILAFVTCCLREGFMK